MDKSCPVYYASNLIGKRWTIVILLELFKGENRWKRYSEIKSKLPQLTPKIFSTRLKELEKEGLISKKVDASTVPIRCDYSLTKKGDDFITVIDKIREWNIKWNPGRKCKSADCKHCMN